MQEALSQWEMASELLLHSSGGDPANTRPTDCGTRITAVQTELPGYLRPLHSAFDVHVTIEPGVPDGGVISQRLPSGDCCGAASTRPADLGSAGRDRRRTGNLRPQNCASVITPGQPGLPGHLPPPVDGRVR